MKEFWKNLIPVIRAWTEGKTIQMRYPGPGASWSDYRGDCPEFEDDDLEWRVKPEPRFLYVNEYAGNVFGNAHTLSEHALRERQGTTAQYTRTHILQLED